MRIKLKKLAEQTMVITGASSGINLTTARMAARAGARVVLAARNESALADIVEEIRGQGGQATYVAADVSKEEDVLKVGEAAVREYGGFDTWVNGAAVSIYARALDTENEDHRRLFDVNYWGVVYGSKIALQHLRTRGGALINIGSVASDRALPLQAAYSASKHAMKAYTEALRMEIEEEKLPVSLTLIKPGSIDTPYIDHAKNQLPAAPTFPPPVYAPETVAKAVLYAAQHPVRDIVVGAGGRVLSTVGLLFPRLMDKIMERTMFSMQQSERPRPAAGNLNQPGDDGRERAKREDFHVFENSMYTSVRLRPAVTGAAALGVATAAIMLMRSRGAPSRRWMRRADGLRKLASPRSWS